MNSREFKLGVICVVVTTANDKTNWPEDFPYKERGEARIYARETSCCDDVKSVAFESAPLNKREIYAKGELIATEKIFAEAN